jgi:hypothetical protein
MCGRSLGCTLGDPDLREEHVIRVLFKINFNRDLISQANLGSHKMPPSHTIFNPHDPDLQSALHINHNFTDVRRGSAVQMTEVGLKKMGRIENVSSVSRATAWAKSFRGASELLSCVSDSRKVGRGNSPTSSTNMSIYY